LVEQKADEILDNANKDDIVLLVVGDPFGATTHADILLRAKDLNINTKVIHNASILNAIGCCGLQVSSHFNYQYILLLLYILFFSISYIILEKQYRYLFGQILGNLPVSLIKLIRTSQMDYTHYVY